MFLSQGEEQDWKGRGQAYGLRCTGLLARYDQDTYSWKIPLCSLLEDSKEYVGDFPKSGILSHGELWGLTMQAHRTEEKGSGDGVRTRHIPTPTVMDAKGYSKPRKVMTKDNFRGVSLKYLVEQEPEKFWSTSTTMDSLPPKTEKGLLNEAKARPGRKKPSNLRDQVTQQDNWEEAQRKTIWPTPVVSDYKGGVTGEAMEGYSEKKKAKRLSALKNAVLFPTPCITGLSSGTGNCEKSNQLYEDGVINDDERRSFRAGNGGQLNPDWEEFLMGWPIGYTGLKPMDKAYFREWMQRAYEGRLWEYDPADLPEDDENHIPRVSRDVPYRKERMIAIGNGQVPSSALLAEEIIYRIGKEISY